MYLTNLTATSTSSDERRYTVRGTYVGSTCSPTVTMDIFRAFCLRPNLLLFFLAELGA